MQIDASTGPLPADVPWLALPVFADEPALDPAVLDSPVGPTLARLVAAKLVGGGVGDLTPVLGVEASPPVLAYGLGKRSAVTAGGAYSAGVALMKRLAREPLAHVAVVAPTAGLVSAIVEGLVVGTKGPDLRRGEKSRKPIEKLTVFAPGASFDEVEAAAHRGETVGAAINLARDLANTPPVEKSPPILADAIAAIATDAGLSVEVWEQSRLVDERFGGLLSVALGSDYPPRFVILRLRSANAGDKPVVALVGKGVTFDSGGLSLKPSASMEDMKSDMTGAAVVLAAMTAAARLGLPVNVDGYLPLTENMTGGRAMKLGDVLTIRNGKTVEVLNTDAEGRLILADALSYAAESKPACIVDLATLTGACMVALGLKYAGLFSNDDAVAGELAAAAKLVGERTWRMPLDDDFGDLIKSTVADLKNVGGKYAGAITAAKFLEQFVAETPWAHLDIAGPSWADNESGSRDAGGTGCFVRTLVAWLEGRG